MKTLKVILLILSFALFACSKKKEANCQDGILNQNEVKTDCGGPCTACPSCSDGIQNQDETGKDCGGTCPVCPTCSDGIKNQYETDIDCGGTCPACPTCSDGIQNQGEAGVDCGGPCVKTCTSPATQNTSMVAGGPGWTNPSCSTTNSLSLKGINGNTEVTLSFASAITSGTYAINTVPGPGICSMAIVNAPNQPSGIIWIGKTGFVSVATSATAIEASFNNVICTQQTFNFPTVAASGTLTCIQ